MTGPLPDSGGGEGGGGICLSVSLQSSGHPRSEQIPAVSSSCDCLHSPAWISAAQPRDWGINFDEISRLT